jgi:hypothetical protein
MAYVSKELKTKAVANLKAALKDVLIKYSVSVQHGSTLVCTISQSDIDFIGNYNDTIVSKNRLSACGRPFEPRVDYLDVNEYWLDSHFTGEALEVLETIKAALLTDEFYNNTDIQSDYFDRSHYISIKIGKFDKPFTLLAA